MWFRKRNRTICLKQACDKRRKRFCICDGMFFIYTQHTYTHTHTHTNALLRINHFAMAFAFAYLFPPNDLSFLSFARHEFSLRFLSVRSETKNKNNPSFPILVRRFYNLHHIWVIKPVSNNTQQTKNGGVCNVESLQLLLSIKHKLVNDCIIVYIAKREEG